MEYNLLSLRIVYNFMILLKSDINIQNPVFELNNIVFL